MHSSRHWHEPKLLLVPHGSWKAQQKLWSPYWRDGGKQTTFEDIDIVEYKLDPLKNHPFQGGRQVTSERPIIFTMHDDLETTSTMQCIHWMLLIDVSLASPGP